MKKDMLITLFIALLLVAGVSLLNPSNPKKEENYFFVDTPIDIYNPLMSNVKGFPFVIKCNNEQMVTVEITSGILQDENGILKENKIPCNTTIYWNTKEDARQTEILLYSNDKTLKKEQFIILKNEKNEYYLSK